MSTLTYKNHIKTGTSVIIMFNESDPITVPQGNPEYDRVCRLLASGQYNKIPAAANRILRLEEGSQGLYTVVDGRVVIDKAPLPPTLSNRILEFVDKGLPIQTFLNFWRNLAENPTESSRKDLYDFLERNHVPLTEDGCFIAYKKVKEGYWDSHTGNTHQYIPGTVVKMPREKVDSNRNNTCSSGLHVAGYNYAKGFSGTKMIEVKVNPKNVCAVPPDYNYTKIRVCELEIIRDCPRYMNEDVQYYDEDEATGFKDEDEDEDEDVPTDEDLDDEDLDDEDLDDEEDEDEEEEEEVITLSIRRLPSLLRWLSPSSDGRLRVPLAALEKIDVESGETVYAFVSSTRSRSIVISSEAPEEAFKEKELVVGTASVRIPASLFRAAQIHLDDGVDEYKLSCSKGTLIIRAS